MTFLRLRLFLRLRTLVVVVVPFVNLRPILRVGEYPVKVPGPAVVVVALEELARARVFEYHPRYLHRVADFGEFLPSDANLLDSFLAESFHLRERRLRFIYCPVPEVNYLLALFRRENRRFLRLFTFDGYILIPVF